MSLKREYGEAVRAVAAGSDRLPLLVNDMVIEEQLCHLRCSYCLTEEFNLLMAVPDAKERLTVDHRSEWHVALGRYDEAVDAPILRLSGGEFFWLPGSDEFVAEAAQRYETVQVITNGVLLKPERLASLARIENLQLNFSLDGHTAEMNRHRFPNEKMFEVVLSHLDAAVAVGIPIEIQTVLTGANAPQVPEFCDFLLDRYGDAVRLYYFPVRGQVAGELACPPGDHLHEVARRYDELAAILPPRAYVEHMAAFVATGVRRIPCVIPATMLQLFGDGNVSACPHAWLSSMGNLRDDPSAVTSSFASHEHYDIFLQPRPRFSFCQGCATPSDVVNLYMFGKVTLEELGRTFLYQGSRSQQRLADLKAAFAPVITELEVEPASRPGRRHIAVRAI